MMDTRLVPEISRFVWVKNIHERSFDRTENVFFPPETLLCINRVAFVEIIHQGESNPVAKAHFLPIDMASVIASSQLSNKQTITRGPTLESLLKEACSQHLAQLQLFTSRTVAELKH